MDGLVSLQRNKNKEDINGKISFIIKELAYNSLYPQLSNQKLIDLLQKEDLTEFIKNNSVLSDYEDIIAILESKLKQVRNVSLEEKKMIDIYSIIFEENKTFNEKVILFSGGTGSSSLTKELTRAGSNLTILLNAYDDGKSTGDIRRKFNILGPSDISKSLTTLLGTQKKEIRDFLEYRLPMNENKNTLKNWLKEAEKEGSKNILNDLLIKIEPPIREELRIFIKKFNYIISKWENENKRDYDLSDYGIRNVIYTGAYFYYNKSYGYVNDKLTDLFDLQGKIILNNEESLWLIAVTDKGILLNSETSVVEDHIEQEIVEIFLVKQPLNETEIGKFYSLKLKEERLDYLRKNFAIYPSVTKEAINILESSEVIVFAPTTFHSSLAPTLLTKGISPLLSNSKALKISVANLVRERGYNTAGENLIELEKYLNYNNESKKKISIDYIIINTHGYRTDGMVNDRMIPIDKENIIQSGVELIEVKIEDLKQIGKHNQDLLTNIIISLKKLEEIGYRIHHGKIIKKENIHPVESKKYQLRSFLANPFLYSLKEEKIKQLVSEILEIDKIDCFKPIRPTKVIILGAGKSTRMKSATPKLIYPILGKANLAHLLEKYSHIDELPLIVINSENKIKLEEWSKANPQYMGKVVITDDLRGTALSLFDVLKKELNDFKGDVFLSWGDITNVRLETIKLTLALHQILESPLMTMPSAWVKNPTTLIVRDNYGRVIDFLTPEDHPKIKGEFGEKDSSVFVFKSKEMLEILNELINESGIEKGRIKELNFLKTISLIKKTGKEVISVACADPKECEGFNTKEKTKLIEKYMLELKKESHYNGEFEEKNDREESLRINHLKKLENYLKIYYKGILLDLDDTLTDQEGNVPQGILDIITKLANKGVFVGIVTGRTNNSLKKKFIHRLNENPLLKVSAKNKIYVYPENGAYCYRLGQENNLLYDEKIPAYMSETAMKWIRKKILEFRDDYLITDHKIQIFIKNPTLQGLYIDKINSLFKNLSLPLVAYRSNPVESSGSILICRKNMDKGFALFNFSGINKIKIDEIVKIGDVADVYSIDRSMLVGNGSFSVNEFDRESEHQVSLILCKGLYYKGLRGTNWLLNNLKFNT